MYLSFKFMHLPGLVLLIGNLTATAMGKVFANRTDDAVVVAFEQKRVSCTDGSLTLGGVLLVTVGGDGMAVAAGLDLRRGWLLWGQLCTRWIAWGAVATGPLVVATCLMVM